MKTFEKYVINQDTVFMIGEIDQEEQPYSIVVEGNQTFLVNMSPVSVIDHSLQYYCSSLKGAWEGSRSILGNISMLPIIIYSPLDIFWFPCYSPYRSDCIWFSHNHVINSEKIDQKKTKVNLNFGHSIVLEMRKERFETKWQRASQLRYISNERTKKVATFYFEPKKGFNMVKQPGKTNYDINFYKKE
jgi:competence protein ComK